MSKSEVSKLMLDNNPTDVKIVNSLLERRLTISEFSEYFGKSNKKLLRLSMRAFNEDVSHLKEINFAKNDDDFKGSRSRLSDMGERSLHFGVNDDDFNGKSLDNLGLKDADYLDAKLLYLSKILKLSNLTNLLITLSGESRVLNSKSSVEIPLTYKVNGYEINGWGSSVNKDGKFTQSVNEAPKRSLDGIKSCISLVLKDDDVNSKLGSYLVIKTMWLKPKNDDFDDSLKGNFDLKLYRGTFNDLVITLGSVIY